MDIRKKYIGTTTLNGGRAQTDIQIELDLPGLHHLMWSYQIHLGAYNP